VLTHSEGSALLKQHTTSEEWALAASDHVLIATRSRARRLAFATLLLFFRANRRFPRSPAEIDTAFVIGLAEALGVDIETSSTILLPSRTMERVRSEVRSLFGFREATVADAEALTAWARDHAVHQTRDIDHLIKVL